MPRKSRRPPKGAVLWGVFAWFPYLAIPLSVFFMEIRWQHEIFANDFEIHRLGKELRESERRMAEYEQEETDLNTMDSLGAKAMELQLVAPGPGQIESIRGEWAGAAPAPEADAAPRVEASRPEEAPMPWADGQPPIASEELEPL